MFVTGPRMRPCLDALGYAGHLELTGGVRVHRIRRPGTGRDLESSENGRHAGSFT